MERIDSDQRSETVSSSGDARTVNNGSSVRHNYRVLSEEEKATMQRLKEQAEHMLDLIDAIPFSPREKALAKTNIEQGVMWAVKALTA